MAVLTATACLFTPACAQKASPAAAQPGPRRIAFADAASHLYHDYHSLLADSGRFVARDSASFAALWQRAVGDQPVPRPPIEFRNSMVVVAALGPRLAMGDYVRIDSLIERPDHVEIRVLRFVMARHCTALPASYTQPVDIVVAPRMDTPIRFVDERIEVASCVATTLPRSRP